LKKRKNECSTSSSRNQRCSPSTQNLLDVLKGFPSKAQKQKENDAACL